jgi:hypothetical protein
LSKLLFLSLELPNLDVLWIERLLACNFLWHC